MDFFMTFIVPVLVVLVLASILAFCLAFLSEKLKPKPDEKLGKIRENLPGINCGGCGYAGCDSFAEALFRGEAKIEGCRPSSKESKERLAEILGMKADKMSEPMVAVVLCNGGTDAKEKADYSGYGDCQNANTVAGGTKVCETGCMGFGTCVKACQYGAITIDKQRGVAAVDPSECVKCGMCLSSCPKNIIGEIPVSAKVYVACSNTCVAKKAASECKRSCIACGLCVKTCPAGAIKVTDNLARIKYDKCTGCGECVKVCPHKCILQRFIKDEHSHNKLQNKADSKSSNK